MIRYRITNPDGRDVEVSLATAGPDDFAPLVFDGISVDCRDLRERLMSSHGVDGHLLHERTTPVDLEVALRGRMFGGYDVSLLEGRDILDLYERKTLP